MTDATRFRLSSSRISDFKADSHYSSDFECDVDLEHFLLPYLVIGISTEYKTIPVVVQMLVGSNGNKDMGALMAMLVLSIIPIIIFIWLARNILLRVWLPELSRAKRRPGRSSLTMRRGGILLPISSIPSKYGIGTFQNRHMNL